DDGLEEAMNVDRRSFRDTHPAYVELRDAFHEYLTETLKQVRDRFYEEQSKERGEQRRARELGAIEEAIRLAEPVVGKTRARRLLNYWSKLSPRARRRLTRKL